MPDAKDHFLPSLPFALTTDQKIDWYLKFQRVD